MKLAFSIILLGVAVIAQENYEQPNLSWDDLSDICMTYIMIKQGCASNAPADPSWSWGAGRSATRQPPPPPPSEIHIEPRPSMTRQAERKPFDLDAMCTPDETIAAGRRGGGRQPFGPAGPHHGAFGSDESGEIFFAGDSSRPPPHAGPFGPHRRPFGGRPFHTSTGVPVTTTQETVSSTEPEIME